MDCDWPFYGKKWGFSSDSLRYHRKNSATGVLLHLSRDSGGYFDRVIKLKLSISLDIFYLDLQNSPQKIGPWWVACLKFSILLENFRVWIRVRFENGNLLIFNEFLLVSPTAKERKHILSEYRLSTVSIVSKYIYFLVFDGGSQGEYLVFYLGMARKTARKKRACPPSIFWKVC